MSEREKKILETLTTALPSMSEFDKGYLMGKGEAIMDMKRAEKKEEEKCIGRGEGEEDVCINIAAGYLYHSSSGDCSYEKNTTRR